MAKDDDKLYWPTTFNEMNLAGDIHIRPEDIADYAYPPGERKRYTNEGWQKALDLGVAIRRADATAGRGVMGDRYSDELRERDRFIRWVEIDNGTDINTDGSMSEDRHWHFDDPYLDRDWCIWSTATGFRCV